MRVSLFLYLWMCPNRSDILITLVECIHVTENQSDFIMQIILLQHGYIVHVRNECQRYVPACLNGVGVLKVHLY